ncbi:MAG: DinB family protein [Anaerolineales bacterium]|nr:DinB family protein [Anaerolineales bacterium]
MATTLRDQLVNLYDFTCWGRDILLDKVAALSLEQFEQDTRFPLNSVKETLVHMLSADWAYHKRLVGEPVPGGLKADDFADVQAIRDAWAVEEGLMRAYLDGADDETLAQVVKFTNSRGEEFERVRQDILFQLLFHGAQHRAELAQILTEYGHSPGDLDYALYVRDKHAA